MLQFSQCNSMMSTPHTKGSHAVILYDLEGYDDAFIKAVEKVEEKHSSPMKSPMFSSPLQHLQQGPTEGRNFSRHSRMGANVYREDVTPKKLDFSEVGNNYKTGGNTLDEERLLKLKSWYSGMISSSNLPVPSLQILEAHGELCQEKALLVLSYFPKGGWEKVVSVTALNRFKNMELNEIDGWLQQFSCGSKFLKTDWSKLQDNHMVFHGEISAEGFCSIKGPYFEQTNSPLQR
eukprot:c11759_g1_i1 orf=157-858(+)